MASKSKSVAESQIYDVDSSSTGSFDVPSGTTAQRPGSANSGLIRFNTTLDSLEFYDGNAWVPTNLVPNISGITGSIKPGIASNIVVAMTNFTSTVSIRFTPTGGSSVDVTGLTGASSLTVAVPSGIYNSYSAGNAVGIKVLNADGTQSNTVSTTIVTLPSGGTITTSGNFRIHKFTSSGNFVNTVANLGVEYLIVAGGGGGGGGFQSGGGGGGGFRTNVSGATSGRGASAEAAMTLSNAATFAVTVGAGGAGGAAVTGTSATAIGSQGGSSAFNSITSLGGGGGSSYWANDASFTPPSAQGMDGGCGGGAGDVPGDQSGGSGTAGQGYDGGDAIGYASPYSGGGGGGAGAAGGNTSSGVAGNGGNGQASSITGSPVTYAGGGGGGGYQNSSGTGGTGGGAAGTTGTGTAIAGTDELGGGGGGIGNQGQAGGAGGSGIVIVRYDLTTF